MRAADLKGHVKTTASLALRWRPVRNATLRAAAARGRSVVLCYHRIGPAGGDSAVIDPVPPARFAEQMRTLQACGEIVPLSELVSRRVARERPAFAVTFDDDHPSHVRYALPVLQELDIPAAFFLSGRALCGLGPYWWDLLERSVEEIGLDATAGLLGYRATTVKELARHCRLGAVPDLPTRVLPNLMAPDDIRALADAGMTIGFHTLRHRVLPLLTDAELERELTEGRSALASAARCSVDFLAYPFGRADARVARAAQKAGYRAAFTVAERPIAPETDAFLLGRVQPGAVDGTTLSANVAFCLSR